jgi:hypothetical protein
MIWHEEHIVGGCRPGIFGPRLDDALRAWRRHSRPMESLACLDCGYGPVLCDRTDLCPSCGGRRWRESHEGQVR